MTDLKDSITIKQDGADREIFMSFGLINEITTIMGDPAQAASVYFSPAARQETLLCALHERSATGKITKAVEAIEDHEISLSDLEDLLAWEVEHAIAFFGRSVKRIVAIEPALQEMTGATSSLIGSKASPSKTRSSGRSK